MPDSLEGYLDPPKTPQQKVHSIARRIGLTPDLAEDFLKVTSGIESGNRHYDRRGRVLRSPAGALGFSQVLPGTAKQYGLDPNDEEQNMEAGLRYFSEGGDDPIARRLGYLSGHNSKAVKSYKRTGQIPKGGDPYTGVSFNQYVRASDGQQQAKSDLENYLDPVASVSDIAVQQPTTPDPPLIRRALPAETVAPAPDVPVQPEPGRTDEFAPYQDQQLLTRKQAQPIQSDIVSEQAVRLNQATREAAEQQQRARARALRQQAAIQRGRELARRSKEAQGPMTPFSGIPADELEAASQQVGQVLSRSTGRGAALAAGSGELRRAMDRTPESSGVMGDFRKMENIERRRDEEIRPRVIDEYFHAGGQNIPQADRERVIASDPKLQQYIAEESQRRAQAIAPRQGQVDRIERGAADTLGFMDKLKDVGSNPAQLVPFLSSAKEIDNLLLLGAAADRAEQGKGTEEDHLLVKEFIAKAKQKTSTGHDIASTLAMLPAFVGEFALTGGAYTAGKKAAVAGLERLISKAALETIEKKTIGRVGSKVVTGLVGGAAQTIPAGLTRIPAGALYRHETQGEDFPSALGNAFADQLIEVTSERAGGLLKHIPVPKRLSAIRDALTSRWLKSGKTMPELEAALKKAGWNGVLGEIFEERVGDVARYGIGQQESPIPTLHQLAVEGITFSIPGVAVGLGGRVLSRTPSAKDGANVASTSKVETPAVPREAEIVKPWEMRPNEIEEAFQRKKTEDANIETTVLGPELAKRYERLQRTANSSRDPAKADAASAEIEKIEAGLSEKDRNRLFGIGEEGPQVEDLRAYRQSLGNLDPSDAQSLGRSLQFAITKLGNAPDDPGRMNHEQQVAYATLREASRIARENGWDTKQVSAEAVKAAAGRFSDPADTRFVLDKFLTKESEPSRPVLKQLPSPKVETPAVPEEVLVRSAEKGGPSIEKAVASAIEANVLSVGPGSPGPKTLTRPAKPFSAKSLQETFNLTPEQAKASEAIADAMGLDKSRIQVVKGGTPAQGALKQDAEPRTLGMHSQLYRTITEKLPNRASVEQVRQLITNPQSGVKTDEVKWSGLDDLLSNRTGITKQEVLDHLRGNQLQIQEVQKGSKSEFDYQGNEWQSAINSAEASGNFDLAERINRAWEGVDESTGSTAGMPKFKQYSVPGEAENYKELLFTLPKGEVGKGSQELAYERQIAEVLSKRDAINDSSKPEWKALDEKLGDLQRLRGNYERLRENKTAKATFKSGHWDEPNVLAHARVDDRVTSDGKKALFVNEVQSDWHQKGRKEGYDRPLTRADYDAGRTTRVPGGVPDAPFSKNWHEFVMRQMLKKAVDGGYDKLAWATGEQSAELYDLSKHVKRVNYNFEDKSLTAVDFGGSNVLRKTVEPQALADYIGKDAAQRIEAERQSGKRGIISLTGDDLKVGGSGMVGFYDKILPDYMRKLGRKFGAKVEETRIPTKDPHTAEYGVHGAGLNKAGEQQWGVYNLNDMLRETGAEPPVATYSSHDQALTHSERLNSEARTNPVHSIEITPAMRKSLDLPLFQGEKASVEFAEGGKALIRSLNAPDVSSGVHEIAHVARRFLLDKDLPQEQRAGITVADISIAERWAGVKDGKWETPNEEKFARGFERYLRDGKAPSPRLAEVFAKFKDWLTNVYSKIKGSDIDVKISPQMRGVYDRLMTRGERIEVLTRPAREPSTAAKKVSMAADRAELDLPELPLRQGKGEAGFVNIGSAKYVPAKTPLLQEVERITQSKPPRAVGAALRSVPTRLQTALTSEFTPLRKLEQKLYGDKKILGVDMARKFEQVAGAPGKAQADIIEFRKNVIEPIRSHADDFNSYLFLKRVAID